MIQWYFCTIVLSIELLLCTVSIMPLPFAWRRKILWSLSDLWNNSPRFRLVTKITMIGVAILLVDAGIGMYRIFNLLNNPDAIHITGRLQELDSDLMKQQRNAFLSTFILFLFTLLYRLSGLVMSVARLEDRIAQSKGLSVKDKEKYSQLLEEKEKVMSYFYEKGIPIPFIDELLEEPVGEITI
eukprot:TRINITY_DN2059_c0_g1_i1.p1 TRINITY_DN2059_c0_g1~~TRINITY_DN2059_c0_g1_i1.p1  ORF type:complete len:184 (-),score=32.62 TRINITY_DN2059_c0_g1_i1:51-602(-)